MGFFDGESVPVRRSRACSRSSASTSVLSARQFLRSSLPGGSARHSPAGVAVASSGRPLCRRGPNHALQRTEAGGGLFSALHVLRGQPLSLSLSSLGGYGFAQFRRAWESFQRALGSSLRALETPQRTLPSSQRASESFHREFVSCPPRAGAFPAHVGAFPACAGIFPARVGAIPAQPWASSGSRTESPEVTSRGRPLTTRSSEQRDWRHAPICIHTSVLASLCR